MPVRKLLVILPLLIGGLLLAISVLMLQPAAPVSAQCGSQASSCKNCHEVQGQKAVNSDGTAWHQSHAFGDFCYICHAGNNQAADKTAAHTGMVAPLADIKASCQQCHPDDLDARAQVYATKLGVEVGSGSSAPAASSQPAEVSQPAATTASAPVVTELAVDDPNLVNYRQRYNEIVLGQKAVNWGNIILVVMIGMVAIGGGGFVAAREKLVKFSFGDTKKAEGEYPTEVVDLLPAMTKLNANSVKTLKTLLENPKKADTVFNLINAVTSEEKENAQ